MSSPAIVHKAKFVSGGGKVFKSYIDYIDRDEATRNYSFNEFSMFNDYMGNPNKSGSLFTSDKDWLTSNDKNSLKEQFKLAQKNGSLMWQDVFSFDNEWLVENGYYDEKTHILDEEKLRCAVRKTMNNQIDKASMDTAIWSASFHYNTDNIHVHVATVELTDNPKERGKRTAGTLSKMKSDFINELRHREKEYKKINEIIRENIVDKKGLFLSSDDKILKDKTIELLKKLPSNRKYWQYNYNKISSLKPLINEISKHYINTYHKEDYEELIKKLTIEELENKRIYGEGQDGKESGRFKDYKKNKINELQVKMGNSILKELREFAKQEEEKNKIKVNKKEEKIESKNETGTQKENNENETKEDSSNIKGKSGSENKTKNGNGVLKNFDKNRESNANEQSYKENFITDVKNNRDEKEKMFNENKGFSDSFKDTGSKYRNSSYGESSKNDFRTSEKSDSEKNKKYENNSNNNKSEEVKFNSRNLGNEARKESDYKKSTKVTINRGTINSLKKALKNDVEKYINQREYEKAENQNQRDREYELNL